MMYKIGVRQPPVYPLAFYNTMTAEDRKRLEFKALSNTLSLEDVYYITLDSLTPYVQFIEAKVHTHITDKEFIIKTTPGKNIEGVLMEPWVYIGKVEPDAIRVYSYLDNKNPPEIRAWNI